MTVLPAMMYRDQADVLDELRKARRKAERERLNKARRIRALVKQSMKRGR